MSSLLLCHAALFQVIHSSPHLLFTLRCIYGVILCAQFFTMMAPGIQAINLARQAAVDIFATIKRTPDIDASSDSGIVLKDYEGSIEMQNVAFSYPSHPENLVFNKFNLSIEAGTSVALVGPSGSGKSTIAKLLLRFYDPIQGDVLADGVTLRDINLKWWRSKIGYVPQEPHLFIGTIRDNIAAGKSSDDDPATDEEVFAAARAACADEFILDLPDGYDTFYSGASIQLSGGQIQRIAIARAIIRDPVILLLDEATSALDSQSEKSVQDALASIRKLKKLTTVTVAHRLSTIIGSDQIAVISDGGIAELGTHTSLLDEGGIYATLCESQGITKDSLEGETAGDVSSSLAVGTVTDKGGVDLKPTGDPDDVEAAMHTSKNVEKPITESEEDEDKLDLSGTRKRLWEYNRPEWWYIVNGVIGACVTGVLKPSEGILYAQIVANFFVLEPDAMREQNRFLSLCFLALAGGALLGNMSMASGFSVSGFRLTRRMRVLTFEKIVRHSMSWFDFPEHSTGELTIRLEEDAEAVSSVTGWALGYNIQVVSSLASGIIIALSFSWQIGLVAIACVPFIMLASFIQAKCTKYSHFKQEGVSASTILEQGLREISLVQAYNLQEKQADSYDDALKPLSKHKVKEGAVAGFVFGFSQFAIFTTFSILFYAGIQLMAKGKVDFTSFFTALLAIMFAAFSLGQANSDFNAQRNGLAAADRIFAVVDEPLDSTDPFSSTGSLPSSLDGSIGFESCCFAYPSRPDHAIYYGDGLNLSIGSKESVAFVGKSGCGKSTALQLVLRFYDVSSGEVLLDKNNVEKLNISWLRGNVGYVGQQPVLFAGSIRDNVLLGNAQATEEEIVNAAKAANAHSFITKLSDGYNTEIGAGGSLLSGGQKQRIAIARAIVSNPLILVLDEATSALDNESEGVVQAALDEMQKMQPRTTLMVAHRLKTVEKCDKIAVLDGGGVKELGSHGSLLEQKGLYYDLWKRQGATKTKEE